MQQRQRARWGAVSALAVGVCPLALLLASWPQGFTFPSGVFVPAHVALTMVAVSAGVATFAVQWFAAGAGVFREGRSRFIGPAFLAAAALELGHLVVSPGISGLVGSSAAERGVAYLLAARVVTVSALVAAARLEPRGRTQPLYRVRLLVAGIGFAVVVALVEKALPRGAHLIFTQGKGSTPLAAGVSVAVIVAAVTGAVVHARAYWNTGDSVSGKLAVALVLSALGETCLALLRHTDDPFSLVGHAYLSVGSWFAFAGVFGSALIRPYRELDTLRAHVEEELVVTIRRLRETTDQREDLLRAVSHDLRNPLQIVFIQAQRLLRDADDDRRRRASAAIITAGRRMDRMLRDLADSARAESGRLELAPAPIALHPFVRELLATSDGVIDASRVQNAVPPGLPAVLADPDRLDRIFANLVGNALKYSRDRVVVRAAEEGDAVRITVEDRGPGISDADLPRIFERYYRGQRHEGEGLGLGLYIVRKMVEAHGGRIWAHSEAGVGSTFCFTLPRSPDSAPAPST
jgi:signal transduction histidine kinase